MTEAEIQTKRVKRAFRKQRYHFDEVVREGRIVKEKSVRKGSVASLKQWARNQIEKHHPYADDCEMWLMRKA